MAWARGSYTERMPEPTDAARASSYRERNSTADRTLDILALFATGRLRITGADLAGELGVARSTAYRYLQTLTLSGFVEEDPVGGFRLGMRIFELARVARASYGLNEVAIPAMRELASATAETALLTRRSRDRVVCLEKVEDRVQPIRFSYERGSVMALNAGASAWPLLAWESEDSVRTLLAGARLDAPTDRSLTDIGSILPLLREIRANGFAVSRGELDPYAVGIGAPVFDEYGSVVACVSIVGLSRRMGDDLTPLVQHVLAAAQRVSDSLALVSQ